MIVATCDGVRRRRLLRWLTRHEIASRYRTLIAEGALGPPEASDVRADDGDGPCAFSDGEEDVAMVKSCWTALEGCLTTFDNGRVFRPIRNGARSTTIIVPHVNCLKGSWGTLSGTGSVPRGDFVARQPPKQAVSSHAVARRHNRPRQRPLGRRGRP